MSSSTHTAGHQNSMCIEGWPEKETKAQAVPVKRRLTVKTKDIVKNQSGKCAGQKANMSAKLENPEAGEAREQPADLHAVGFVGVSLQKNSGRNQDIPTSWTSQTNSWPLSELLTLQWYEEFWKL